jgi:hypothetical protein
MTRTRNLHATALLMSFAAATLTLAACNKPAQTAAVGPQAATPGELSPTPVAFPPPALPVYEQPPAPGDGYIWTPGDWRWDDSTSDYYWVPGTWVLPPRSGLLWTPGYWDSDGGSYQFHNGYWGSHVGYYGGINYGYGYTGSDYQGGYWQGNSFYYNRAVNNVPNSRVTNTYNKAVYQNANSGRGSYNGPGGVSARPTPQQAAAARDVQLARTPIQTQHIQMARTQPALRASFNHGRPGIAATAQAGLFGGPGVVPATRASVPYNRPAGMPRPGTPFVRPVATARPAPNVVRPAPAASPFGRMANRPAAASPAPNQAMARPPVRQASVQAPPPRPSVPRAAPPPQPKPQDAQRKPNNSGPH